MSERLSTLLRENADALVVPPADADVVLRRGRAARRRSQVIHAVGTVALVGVIAGAVVVATRGDGSPDTVRPADRRSPTSVVDTGATFTLGTTLWYDDGSRQVTIPDKAVKSLYYTSAGVLVRHGDNDWSDGGGPQRFSLVTPDGEVRRLGLVTEEVAHTTDPTQPVVAWGQIDDAGTVELVVHDVSTDREVARVPLPEAAGGDYVSTQLAGDTAYVQVVQYEGEATFLSVAWRTGKVAETELSISDVGGNHGVENDGSVVDLASGATVYRPVERRASLDLSPDGRYVLVSRSGRGGTTTAVVDLRAKTGERELAGLDRYTWTAGGEAFNVAADWITTCDPATGRCEGVRPNHGVNRRELVSTLRLGGATYES